LILVTQGISKLAEATAKAPGGAESIHVYSKGTYRDKIEDVPVDEVAFFVDKITSLHC
jgi:hypothetical protein